MLKIKQIMARNDNQEAPRVIDEPLNNFIANLKRKGEEIYKITYLSDNNGDVFSAIVEYDGSRDSDVIEKNPIQKYCEIYYKGREFNNEDQTR